MTALRIAFMGTPEFSSPVLAEILDQGHEVVAVYSQPPRPAGRGKALRKSPVHEFAESRGIEVRTPTALKGVEEQADFKALDLDVAVVVAYGLILPQAILAAPRLGCLNLHASLLPRWRGAAPIQRAIMAGDSETGVMVMQMDEGLDTGPVLLTERTAIGPRETAGSLHDRLSQIGASLIAKALSGLTDGQLDAASQPAEGITYAHKVEKAEGRINWSLPAAEIDSHIRGLTPWPGAFFEIAGKRVKVISAKAVEGNGTPGTAIQSPLVIACGEGALSIDELQPAGKRPMTAEEFLRGTDVPLGTQAS